MRPLTSASNIYRRFLCPGSARMEQDLPDIKTAESVEGDTLHAYRAHPEWERRILPHPKQDLLRLADRLERQIFETIGLDGAYVQYRESDLREDLISGHPDLLRVYEPPISTSVIIDDKFGWSPVQPADVNLQLRAYAILAPTPTVYVAIAQPRLPFADRITIAKYSEESKAAARAQIIEIIRRTEQSDAVLVPGEEQCRYCKARAVCPALREAVTKHLVPFQFEKDLSKTKMLSIVEQRLAQASDNELGGLFAACALARLVSPPLGEEIRRRIEKGQMEGYTLGKEVEVRVISNVRKAVSLLVLNRVLSREEILERAELSIGGLEQELRKATGVSGKEAREEINRVLAEVIEIETRKPRILRK